MTWLVSSGRLWLAVAMLEIPIDAPNISFAVHVPVPKPRAAAPLRAPGAPLRPPSPTPSSTDAALASLLEWIPTIRRVRVRHGVAVQVDNVDPYSRRHMLAGGMGPISCRGSGVERRGQRDIAWWCVGGAGG